MVSLGIDCMVVDYMVGIDRSGVEVGIVDYLGIGDSKVVALD